MVTVAEISLMLRSGCSSATVLQDVATRHFVGTLDLEAEIRIREVNASPALIQALKSGNYAASEQEKIAGREL